MSRPYRMDRNSLICAVDWLADGCSMEAIVAHMKDQRREHKITIPDAEIREEIQRARDTWPSVRDDYEGI
jgi:hypothetical protein